MGVLLSIPGHYWRRPGATFWMASSGPERSHRSRTSRCTHWHADHVGLALRLTDLADARCCLGADDAPLPAAYATERERRLERDATAMRAWGVPDAIVDAIIQANRPSPLPDRFPVDPLSAGETVGGLEVVDTPSHTKGHISLLTESGLLVGDALLPTYTPNVGGSDTRTLGANPLETYRDTLERITDLVGGTGVAAHRSTGTTRSIYPGHGEPCSPERLATVEDHHDHRRARVVTALEGREPRTPWQVARTLFGDLEGVHATFGAGEAAAHLESLASRDVVCASRRSGVLHYEAFSTN